MTNRLHSKGGRSAEVFSLPNGHLPRARSSSIERRSLRTSVVLVVPALLLTAVFLLYPVGHTVVASFSNWDGVTAPQFVGLKQFVAVFSDEVFYTALRNTSLFAVLSTAFTVGIGLYLAIVLNRGVELSRFYRFVFFLPVVLPGTIISIMWSNAFDPNFGWLNRFLEDYLGVPGGGLLANPDTAIFVICFVAIWHGVGLPMVLILGGLQDIPKEVIEAARIDGAGNLRIAWSISIPITKDVIATVTLLQLIGAFKVFDTVQALTRGGPGTATHVFSTLIYRDAFILGDFGYASALAVVASTLIIGVTFLYMAFLRPSQIEKAG